MSEENNEVVVSEVVENTKDKKKEGNVEGALNAAAGLVKAVPVYQDAIQPVAKEVGKAFQTVGMVINHVLEPIRRKVWNNSDFNEFISEDVNKKLKNTPADDIITPPLNVAGPAFDALRYVNQNEEIKDLFANLLASAMDKSTSGDTHPSFVEILKQISSDEAKLIQHLSNNLTGYPLLDLFTIDKQDPSIKMPRYSSFSNLEESIQSQDEKKITAYIDNLCRLGLFEVPEGLYLLDASVYKTIEEHPKLTHLKELVLKERGETIMTDRRLLRPTKFGQLFIDTCVIDHSTKRQPQEEQNKQPTT